MSKIKNNVKKQNKSIIEVNGQQKDTLNMQINRHINRAIATTVVVTAIGISSTIGALPIVASVVQQRDKSVETYIVVSISNEDDQEASELEIEEYKLEDIINQLLKEGNYAEAREIRKSFFKYSNPLSSQLRSLKNYAVHTV